MRKWIKPAAERKAILIRMAKAGASYDQIVEATGYARLTVENLVHRGHFTYPGLRALGARPPIPQHLIPEWVHLRRYKKLTAREAAEVLKNELDMAREPGLGTIHA